MAKQTQKDARDAEERTAPPGEVVHLAIHREGEHELGRDSMGLAWSGLAAGLALTGLFADVRWQCHWERIVGDGAGHAQSMAHHETTADKK